MLPRRAFLGIELAPDMTVKTIAAGSMAEHAGVAIGDVLVAVDGTSALRDALRNAKETMQITVLRNGERIERTVATERRPSEPGNVEYGEVEVQGARLRTIVTRPDESPKGAVLFLQGIPCDSLDFGKMVAPLSYFLHGLTREGLVTMRVEKMGVGDSDGDASTLDFETEVLTARAGLRKLATESHDITVIGHSIGGMIAPLLAADGIAKRVIVYGTSAMPWLDCLGASTRRQLTLRGDPEPEAKVKAERHAILANKVVHGRNPAFHHQLHAQDLAAAWRAVRLPVLVVQGSFDWVVGEDEAREVAALSEGRFESAIGYDHAMTRHADLPASLQAYGAGALDPALVLTAARFITPD